VVVAVVGKLVVCVCVWEEWVCGSETCSDDVCRGWGGRSALGCGLGQRATEFEFLPFRRIASDAERSASLVLARIEHDLDLCRSCFWSRALLFLSLFFKTGVIVFFDVGP